MSDEHLLTPEEAGMSYRKPLRDAIAAAIFDAAMPNGLLVTWADLTNPSVAQRNIRSILRVYRQADAVLAVVDSFGDKS